MIKYINRVNNKIAIIINDNAAGMCKKTLGMTIIIYKYEEDNYDYPFIMEHLNFYKEHTEIKS